MLPLCVRTLPHADRKTLCDDETVHRRFRSPAACGFGKGLYMKIVVLAGGLSPERDVSLSSGSLIANALIENGHDVLLLDLYLGYDGDAAQAEFLNRSDSERYSYTIPEREPDLEALKASSGNGRRLVGNGVLELCQRADVVFIALHGDIGENGQLQAMFDVLGVCYTGTDYTGCLLAMDKDISKKLMAANGISTAGWRSFPIRQQEECDFSQVRYPCVVKPCNGGSSVGVTMVDDADSLEEAIHAARVYEDQVIVEDRIFGREFSVGILNGEALPVIEVIPKEGFYDYKNKYQTGLTQEICPAQLPDRLTRRLQESALAVHQLLRLGCYSRIDFMLDRNNQVYCLEANTLPGMTPTSLIPQEAEAAGISYPQLCERIVQQAWSEKRA